MPENKASKAQEQAQEKAKQSVANPYAEGKGADQDIKDYLAGGKTEEGEPQTGGGFAPNSNMVGKQTLTHADQEPNAGDFDKDREDEEALNEGEVILNPGDVSGEKVVVSEEDKAK